MSDTTNETIVEVKLTKAELQAQYAVLREEAKAAHDPMAGKFHFQTAAEFKNAYNVAWDLNHPNEKDALSSTEQVLQIVDDAVDTTTQSVVNTKETASKMFLATAIFNAELKSKGLAGLVRKDILTRFINEANCTKAGANTYYNTIRDKAGLVKHKA